MNQKELIVLEPKSSLLREHEPPYTAGNMHIMHRIYQMKIHLNGLIQGRDIFLNTESK